MASLKDLRNRIASVKATQKITKAMQMVAAAKLRRAQEAAEAARPYSAAYGMRFWPTWQQAWKAMRTYRIPASGRHRQGSGNPPSGCLLLPNAACVVVLIQPYRQTGA